MSPFGDDPLGEGNDASRMLIDAMQDGLLATGAEGEVIRVSPSFCRMTGFTEEELIGTTRPYPFWPDEALDEIVAASARFRSGAVQEFDLTFRRKDGTRIPVIVSAALIGGGPGGVAIVKDVTMRRRDAEAPPRPSPTSRGRSASRGLGSYGFDLPSRQ